jgi:hypothetical protein
LTLGRSWGKDAEHPLRMRYKLRRLARGCGLLAALGILASTVCAQTTVKLNELLANGVALQNGAGKVTDWVELFNTSTAAVDLSGSSLTDDTTKPRKYIFPPGTTIAPNGYRVVLLDGDVAASLTPVPLVNAGFSLKANGDKLYFYASPAQNNVLIDSVVFGLQLPDKTIGRSPNGTGAWTLCVPSANGSNRAVQLGTAAGLKVNEWMASPNSGDDWFEIYNSSNLAVDLSGLFLTDTLTLPTQHAIRPLSYIGNELDAYVRFWASGDTNSGANHVNFKLSGNGESLGIFSTAGTKIDSITFAAQQDGISEGRLPDGAAGFAKFPKTSSPGEPNFATLSNVVINEVLAHTDEPLEDAVEIYNPTATRVDIGGWYLSNQRTQLKKYRIPAGTFVEPNGYVVIYESQFDGPAAASPFTFNSAHGDEVYLSQADASGNLTGARVGEVFEASENGVSLGRYQTSVAGDYKFVAMSSRSFGQDDPVSIGQFELGKGAPNPLPKVGPIVINEIMYHPPDIGTNDNVIDEYIELANVTPLSVPLYDPQYPTNKWRLQNAVDFDFPGTTVIPANSIFLVVSFDPIARGDLLAAFRTKFNVPAGVQVLGPYTGKLDNNSEAVEIYRPDPVQLPPHPDAGFVPFIRADKVNYEDAAPWPTGADGSGQSMQRKNSLRFGNDPINWQAAAPTPGRPNGADIADADGDGMPDAYETSKGFNPNDAKDAAQDADSDSFTNLQEFIAGTDPKNASSKLQIDRLTPSTGAGVPAKIVFTAQAGKTYTVQYRNSLKSSSWQTLQDVPAQSSTAQVEVQDASAATRFDRYYRVITPGN